VTAPATYRALAVPQAMRPKRAPRVSG
jgi:hypothetical protein